MKTYKLIYGDAEVEVDFKGSYKKAYEKVKELVVVHYKNTHKDVCFWIEEDGHLIKHGIMSKCNIPKGGD